MTVRKLRLMADYDCWPLWESKPDGLDNVDPGTLPISPELAAQLVKWSEDFDAILNRDDPRGSGFASPEAEEAWRWRGRLLAQRLRTEIGRDYEIVEQI